METLAQDLRYTFRAALKGPGLTLIAIGALALGIGANTAIFSVIQGMLLRALPYYEPERLVTFSCSLPDARDIRESSRSLDQIAIWASTQYTIPGKDNAQQVMGATVSPEFFRLLGQASLGRTFRADEDREFIAVISHNFWVSHFSRDPQVLGNSLKLNDQLYTIVGVLPREFTYPGSQFKVWVPLGSALGNAPEQSQNRQLRIFRIVAHLAPGVSLGNAQAELDQISSRLARQYSATNAGIGYRMTPLTNAIVGSIRPVLLALFLMVALVLLIACANVANLLLARTTARIREISIRTALGATRSRILRLFLTESLLWSTLGSLLGLILASLGLYWLRRLNPGNLPRMESVQINAPVLLFTIAMAFLTAVACGILPALQASRINQFGGLKEGGRGTSSRAGRKTRDGLVIAEIAFSLVVLIAAGLLIKSFARLMRVPMGFESEHLVSVPVLLTKIQAPRRAEVMAQVVERVSTLPGITAVGGGSGLPPISPQRGTRFEVEGADNSNLDQRFAYFLIITPDYFRTLGTRLLEGRWFTERDEAGSPKVVIINRELAERLFPNHDPIGKRVRLLNPDQSAEWRTVVGVVEKVRYSGLEDPSDAQIYTPFAQTPFLWTYLMVRSGPSAPGAGAIRAAIESVNAGITAGQLQSMDELVFTSAAQPRFQTLLVAFFGGIALALALIGIYGVMSYSVAQRTHEIGVRMAIGAQRLDVLGMFLAQGSRLAAVGIATGVVLAFAFSRFLESMLFEVKTTDIATFLTVSLMLASVAVFASYVPARRATKVDPMVALHYE